MLLSALCTFTAGTQKQGERDSKMCVWVGGRQRKCVLWRIILLTCISLHLCVCLCLSDYVNIHVCVCPRTMPVCVCVSQWAAYIVCRLCTSCVGHVEEDVSWGQELAAGREGGSPALCLEAQTLGAALTRCSELCVYVCVRREFWREKARGNMSMFCKQSIKSDKRINTCTTMKTHKSASLLVVAPQSQRTHT